MVIRRNKLAMKRFCKQCGTETTKRVCLPCGAFRTRLCRALKSLKDGGEPHIVTDYHKLTDEEKAKFRKNHQNLYGSCLTLAIVRQYSLTKNSDLVGRAFATAHIMDEAELHEIDASQRNRPHSNLKTSIKFTFLYVILGISHI